MESAPDCYSPNDYIPYPFFLGFAATYTAKHLPDAQVHFRDSVALRESYATFLRSIVAEQYDYLITETATPSWDHDAKLIAEIHRLCPKTRIVVTGPITTTRHEEILGQHPVHACIRGEYEKGSVRVLSGEAGLIDFDLMTQDEMNAAPPPCFNHLYAYRYWDHVIGSKQPQLQTWSSRGCRFLCSFCVWPAAMTGNDDDGTHKRRVRLYSPDWMDAWLSDVTKRFQFRSIYDDADIANQSDAHTIRISECYRKTGLPWAAMCRADTIKRETWKVMKDAGCFAVKIGFESLSQHVVDKIINKALDITEAIETARYIRSLGMHVHGTFLVGMPSETPEQMQTTIRGIEALHEQGVLSTHQLSGAAALDGTPLQKLLQVGRLEKYPGATPDGFDREPDGNKKIAKLLAT
jgi:radical SAM superfamily enzyme YgiQ (UPF0313 family)